MDDETQIPITQPEPAPDANQGQEDATTPAERYFAPLPSLKRTRRPLNWRRALITTASVVIAIALLGGILGVVSLARQRQQQRARAAATSAAATASAQVGGMFPPRATIAAVSMDSPNDGWALENYQSPGKGAGQPQSVWYALRIANGAVTRQATLPVTGFGPTPILQALSPTDVWALFSIGPTAFLHYNGRSWSAVSVPPPAGVSAPVNLEMFTMRAPQDGWAVGLYSISSTSGSSFTLAQAFYHYDGSAWVQDQADPSATAGVYADIASGQAYNGQITGMSSSPDGNVWATANLELMDGNGNITSASGYLYHCSADGVWHVTKLANQELLDVAMTGDSGGWIIGVNNSISQFGSDPPLFEDNQTPLALTFDGTNWAPAAIPAATVTQAGTKPQQVVASGPSDVWIVGPSNGASFTLNTSQASNSDYLVHFNGSDWSSVAPPQAPAINPTNSTSIINQTSFGVIASAGAGDVWLAGGLNTINQNTQTYAYHPLLYHYAGGVWINVPLPRV